MNNKINTTLVYAKHVKVSAIIIYLVFCLSNLGLMGWTSWMLCYVGTSIISSTKFDSKIWVRSFNRDHSPHHTTVRSYIWYHHCIRQKHQQTSWSEKSEEGTTILKRFGRVCSTVKHSSKSCIDCCFYFTVLLKVLKKHHHWDAGQKKTGLSVWITGLLVNNVSIVLHLHLVTIYACNIGILAGMWPCGTITLLRELFLAESKSQVYGHLHQFLQSVPSTASNLSKLQHCHVVLFMYMHRYCETKYKNPY